MVRSAALVFLVNGLAALVLAQWPFNNVAGLEVSPRMRMALNLFGAVMVVYGISLGFLEHWPRG